MTPQSPAELTDATGALLANGSGAAAILSAGIASLVLGIFNVTDDVWPAAHNLFLLWPPSGSLSGISGGVIVVWLVSWAVLAQLWAGRSVRLTRVNAVALAMLVAGLLLTFPPFADLVEGL